MQKKIKQKFFSIKFDPRQWYFEYHNDVRWTVHFLLMILSFPLIGWVTWDDPHSSEDDIHHCFAFIGITIDWGVYTRYAPTKPKRRGK